MSDLHSAISNALVCYSIWQIEKDFTVRDFKFQTFGTIGNFRPCLFSGMHPSNVTTPGSRALPRVPGPDSRANILRQPAERLRVDVSQSSQPHPAGEDDNGLFFVGCL